VIALLFLLAQSPSPAPVAPGAGTQEIFEQRCKLCHGVDGRGKTKKGIESKAPDFTRPRWQKHTTDDEIREAITNGVPKSKMKGFKDKLTTDQIDALGKYVRAFGDKKK
jgi:mono/diheme cytochrome c family protein